MALLIQRSFNVAFDAFSPAERDILRARFCDPLMYKFLQAQIACAQEQMSSVDPSAFKDEDAHKFLYAAKETRSIWQFWVDFANFVQDWAKEKSGRAQDGE